MLWGKEFSGISYLYIGINLGSGLFWPGWLGSGWAQAGNQGRIRSAGAAVGFGHALKGFFDVLATARPGGFLTDITSDF